MCLISFGLLLQSFLNILSSYLQKRYPLVSVLLSVSPFRTSSNADAVNNLWVYLIPPGRGPFIIEGLEGGSAVQCLWRVRVFVEIPSR